MKIDIEKLTTIKNYASKLNFTPAYIYKLIRENKIQAIVIDGVFFIDTIKFPRIPTNK